MTIEFVILLITSVLATLKAYFECKKAKFQSNRADNTENMLKYTIRSVEIAKCNLNKDIQKNFVSDMHEYIKMSPCDTDKNYSVVKKITEGDGDIRSILS